MLHLELLLGLVSTIAAIIFMVGIIACRVFSRPLWQNEENEMLQMWSEELE